MKVAITGGYGFLGWHLACRLKALTGLEPIRLGRSEFLQKERLAESLRDVDTVYHLAGVNRAASDREVEEGNVELAEATVKALAGRPAHIVYADTIHADADTPYGRGKAAAGEILKRAEGTVADVCLPNLFGEHGRPAYNSFVATFCHEVAQGREPSISNDRPIPLMHAQAAAQALMRAGENSATYECQPETDTYLISDVLGMIRSFHACYGSGRGEVPDLSTPFAVDLFNTYRSYLFPERPVFHPVAHGDSRGVLVETVRTHGGAGQAYVSTTVPGATRGEHYHLRKVERFLVVKGEAVIKLRRLLHDDIVSFRVNGSEPGVIDMPTLWVHNIRNVGNEELITMFWSNQLLDATRPDQFQERVENE